MCRLFFYESVRLRMIQYHIHIHVFVPEGIRVPQIVFAPAEACANLSNFVILCLLPDTMCALVEEKRYLFGFDVF